MRRESVDPFYRLPRWLALRERVLRRDGYMCRESLRYGKRAEATTVHHIFPRREFPEYQWEPWNLVSLCAGEHDRMHVRGGERLTERGVALLRRTARAAGIEVPEKYRT